MMATDFKVRDRVRIAGGSHDAFLVEGGAVGRLGVVTDHNSARATVEVEFEGEPIEGENRWWFRADGLELLDEGVSHPSHYREGMPSGVEVIDIIRAQKAGYLHGNLIKYVLRWKYKNGVEDLRKARVYLDWLIEEESNK